MGTKDFWGNNLKNENTYDIGAFEWKSQTSGIYSTNLKRIVIYPNPIRKEDLTIDLLKNSNSPTHLKLFDISGKLWVEQKLIESSNHIKTSSLPSGLYFVLISDSNSLKSFSNKLKQLKKLEKFEGEYEPRTDIYATDYDQAVAMQSSLLKKIDKASKKK